MSDSPKEILECEETDRKKNKALLAADQQDRGYYYDDAHGYEKYDPEKDQDAGEDEETDD